MALQDVEHEGRAPFLGKRSQDGVEARQRAARVGGAFRRAVHRPIPCLVERQGALAGVAGLAQGDSGGDAPQPGEERGIAAEAGKRAEGLHEDGLHQVFHVGAWTREPMHHAVQTPNVQAEELSVAFRIPRLSAAHVVGDMIVFAAGSEAVELGFHTR